MGKFDTDRGTQCDQGSWEYSDVAISQGMLEEAENKFSPWFPEGVWLGQPESGGVKLN